MSILSKLFEKNKNDDNDEDIPYDAFKKKLTNEVVKPSGCEKCYNKHNNLCKGKNFACEAFRPLDSETSIKNHEEK